MKTQILYLEPHDDVVSARDKMGWGQTPRILLVLPKNRRILGRRLDLTLLLRHSQAQRAQLALVTADPQVQFNASELGIPTFRNIEDAQTRRWRRFRRVRRPPLNLRRDRNPDQASSRQNTLDELKDELHENRFGWMEQPQVRLLVFAFGVLAVIVLAGVLAPSAEISLPPAVDSQSTSFTAEAKLDVQEFGITGALPIRALHLEVEGRDTLETSGTQKVPGQPATGSIELTNLTDQEITVPAGTVVLNLQEPLIRFETTRVVQLPAGSGEQASVSVRALNRGEAGNLPADSLKAVEGSLGLNVSVTNLAPTRGGTDFVGPAASPIDRRRLHDRLVEALRDTAAEELLALLNTGDMPLLPSPQLENVLEEVFEPENDTPAERLGLLLRLEFKTLIVQEKDLQQLAAALLDANLPPGYAPVPDTVELTHLTEPIWIGEDTARWQVKASRQIIAQLSPNEATYLSLGLPPDLAQERLESAMSLAGSPEIAVWPTWWPRLPVLPFRIQVQGG